MQGCGSITASGDAAVEAAVAGDTYAHDQAAAPADTSLRSLIYAALTKFEAARPGRKLCGAPPHIQILKRQPDHKTLALSEPAIRVCE